MFKALGMAPRRGFMLAALALLAGACSAPSHAAGLQVTPVLLEFKPGQRAQAVWLSNTSGNPVQAQLRVKAWRQVDGEDVLEDTVDIAASPPLVDIAAGQTQLVRLIRSGASTPSEEQAYRLLVDELPASNAGASEPKPAGVQFLFRYLIPVFLTPRDFAGIGGGRAEKNDDAPPSPVQALRAELVGSEDGVHLSVRNEGVRHAKLSDVSFVGKGGENLLLGGGLFGYVLNGATRQWKVQIPPAVASAGGTLKARINKDKDESTLVLEPSHR